jgi:hypothetical protein
MKVYILLDMKVPSRYVKISWVWAGGRENPRRECRFV